MSSYKFRPGHRVKGVSPDDAGRELERIRKSCQLTAATVVETAADPQSPIHPAFEWDDAVAGHEYRLQQARQLIRAVCVVVEHDEDPSPVYVHVTTEEDGGRYESLAVVARSPDLFDSAMHELKNKLAGAQRAVRELKRAAEQAGSPVQVRRADTVAEHLAAAEQAAIS